MGLNLEELGDRYGRSAIKLLPPGRALRPRAGSNLEKLLRAFATEYAGVRGRAEQLVDESDPRTTSESLEQWEEQHGLPGACAGDDAPSSTILRRAAVTARVLSQGGASLALIQSVAAELGFEVTITEHRPFQAEFSQAGDKLFNDEWVHVFDVSAPELSPIFFEAGASEAGDPLVDWSNSLLTCALGHAGLAPAHTLPRFFFDQLWDGYQPWDPVEFYPPSLSAPWTPQRPTLSTT